MPSIASFFCRVMPSFRILARRVLEFRPRISAAPFFPSMRHPVFRSTWSMWSCSSSARTLTSFPAGSPVFRKESNRSNTCSALPWLMITARSMTLSSSRTLPGQWYSSRAFMVSFDTVSIFLPIFLLNLATKCLTSSGMSSLRCLSGGIVIGKTLSR